MANICSINIILRCEKEENTELIYKYLDEENKIAIARDEGLWLDKKHRPMFDLEFEYDVKTKSINAYGWVKWGLLDDEVIAFFKYLDSKFPVEYMRIDYDESGSLLYGYYEYDDGVLIDCFVSEDEIEKITESIGEDDDWSEIYYVQLDEILDKNPSQRLVYINERCYNK